MIFYKFKGIATSIEEIKQLLNNEYQPQMIDVLYQPQINGHLSTDLQLTFEYIDKKEKIILPLYFKALIDKTKNDNDKKFIEYLYNKYSESNPKLKTVLDYIKSMPNFQIDELSKNYVKLYTIESDFYRDLNKDLRLKKREQYMPYIKTLYEGIKEKALPLSSDNMLYRGTSISKFEIKKLKGYLKNKIKGLPSSIVFCNSFLSFSKEKKVAQKFFNNFSNNTDLCRVLFTLEKDDNIGFDLSTHCDIEKLSVLAKEKEVLFLPFSSFEVKEMKEININNEITYEIKLLYLGRYLKKIEANKNLYLNENKLPDSEFKKELSEFGIIPKEIIENMTIKNIFNAFEKYKADIKNNDKKKKIDDSKEENINIYKKHLYNSSSSINSKEKFKKMKDDFNKEEKEKKSNEILPSLQKFNCDCCERNCKAIIIISVIVFLLIGIIVLIVKIPKREKKTEKYGRCLKYNSTNFFDSMNSTNASLNKECILCKNEFYLYKGECVPYVFSVTYRVDYYNETIKIYNPDEIKNLIGLKINDQFIEPISELSFNQVDKNQI